MQSDQSGKIPIGESPTREMPLKEVTAKITNDNRVCGQGPVGGRLVQFHQHWSHHFQDRWVISTVRKGYAIDFVNCPPGSKGPVSTSVPCLQSKQIALDQAIQALAIKKVVEPVPLSQEGQGFYSTLFLVPKKPDGWRPVLNLKPLNKYVERRVSN